MQVACVHINVKIYTCANLCVQSVLLCTESPPITLQQRKEHQHVSRRSCNPCLNGIAPLWDFFLPSIYSPPTQWNDPPSHHHVSPRIICTIEKDTAKAITSSSVSATRSRQISSNSSSCAGVRNRFLDLAILRPVQISRSSQCFSVQTWQRKIYSFTGQIIQNLYYKLATLFFPLQGCRHITKKLSTEAGILAIPHHDLVAEAFRGVVDQNDDPQPSWGDFASSLQGSLYLYIYLYIFIAQPSLWT